MGTGERRLERRSAVAREAPGTEIVRVSLDRSGDAGHRPDRPGAINHPDDLIDRVGDVHVAGGVEGHHPGLVDLGVEGGAAVAVVARFTGTGDG